MKTAIVDYRISAECEQALVAEGFAVIRTEPYRRLSQPICAHTDMLLFKLADRLFTPRDYYESHRGLFEKIENACPSVKIIKTSDIPEADYPRDAKMNLLSAGGAIFANRASASGEIISYAEGLGLDICEVKQGYPACTVLVLRRAAITADRGMARALERRGLSVTLISEGGVSLPPYKHGFIGGAAGIYGRHVYFAGALSRHPDGDRIAEACRIAGFEPISLGSAPLHDVGGILFLEENVD